MTTPCGGCGATTSEQRCIGCRHIFGDECSTWFRQSDADSRIAALTAERDAAVAEVARLRGLLGRLCRCFPTDSDMREAGWESHDIDKACGAYDAARAALHPTQAGEVRP